MGHNHKYKNDEKRTIKRAVAFAFATGTAGTNAYVGINGQTGTTYTLVLTDTGAFSLPSVKWARLWTASELDDKGIGLIVEDNTGVVSVYTYSYKATGMNIRCVQAKAGGESDGNSGTLTDIDGNVYEWVVIGDYRWMAENLRTTRLSDGTSIPNIAADAAWAADTYGARCAYDVDDYYVYPPLKL